MTRVLNPRRGLTAGAVAAVVTNTIVVAVDGPNPLSLVGIAAGTIGLGLWLAARLLRSEPRR